MHPIVQLKAQRRRLQYYFSHHGGSKCVRTECRPGSQIEIADRSDGNPFKAGDVFSNIKGVFCVLANSKPVTQPLRARIAFPDFCHENDWHETAQIDFHQRYCLHNCCAGSFCDVDRFCIKGRRHSCTAA